MEEGAGHFSSGVLIMISFSFVHGGSEWQFISQLLSAFRIKYQFSFHQIFHAYLVCSVLDFLPDIFLAGWVFRELTFFSFLEWRELEESCIWATSHRYHTLICDGTATAPAGLSSIPMLLLLLVTPTKGDVAAGQKGMTVTRWNRLIWDCCSSAPAKTLW